MKENTSSIVKTIILTILFAMSALLILPGRAVVFADDYKSIKENVFPAASAELTGLDALIYGYSNEEEDTDSIRYTKGRMFYYYPEETMFLDPEDLSSSIFSSMICKYSGSEGEVEPESHVYGEENSYEEVDRHHTIGRYFETPVSDSDFYLRVGLKYGSSAVKSVDFSSDSGFYYASISKNGWTEVYDLRDYVNLSASISPTTGKVIVTDAEGNQVLPSVSSSCAFIAASENRDNSFVKINGKQYRDGVMIVSKRGRKTFNVGNYITMEHYLWGVIHKEMSSSNELEALKAQALCCRSYAYKCIGKHSGDGFDICGKASCCQSYGAVGTEKKRTVQACKETAGKYILYNGSVITAYYHASSGGYTMGSASVWGRNIGYCQPVEDPYGSSSGTSHVYSFAQIKSALASYKSGKYNVGDISSVSVASVLPGGTAAKVAFTGTKGTSYLTAAQLYSMFGFKSPRIGLNITEPSAENGTGGSVNFIVYGRGHCVGMPQISAEKMAKQGFTGEEIVKYFYTGTEVGKIR